MLQQVLPFVGSIYNCDTVTPNATGTDSQLHPRWVRNCITRSVWDTFSKVHVTPLKEEARRISSLIFKKVPVSQAVRHRRQLVLCYRYPVTVYLEGAVVVDPSSGNINDD